MRLVLDALGVKSGGSVTVLLDLLRAGANSDRIHKITVLASPTGLRQYVMPDCDKLDIEDVGAAENPRGRVLWALRGLDQRLSRMSFEAFLGLNGLGSVQRRFPSLVFVQQPVPYSREALRRFSLMMRVRMAAIRWLTGRSVKAADHVLVQSASMREAISRAFGVPFARIAAFMPGAPILPAPTTNSPKLLALRSKAEKGVLLYVGSDAPHKNLSVVAHGLQRMPESRRPRWYVTLSENSLVCRQGLAVSLGTLNRAELHEAYRNATLVILPSLTETVGLPMLEAMRVGAPVLAADRPYAHEVCEDAAAFFDPLSPVDFADKAARLLADAQWRADLATRGLALVRRRDAADPYRGMLEKVVEVAEARGRQAVVSSR